MRKNTNVSINIKDAIEKIHLTTSIKSVLTWPAPELAKFAKLTSGEEVEILIEAIPTRRPTFNTAWDFCSMFCKLSLGCRILDKHLGGGIRPNGITEIYGESATGKTQFCLQLSLIAQLPVSAGGLDGGAVYICTEDKFPDQRFEQIKLLFQQQHRELLKDTNVGDNIFIKMVENVQELIDTLDKRLPALLKYGNVKLLIIDSIAGLFRVQYSMKDMYKRTIMIRNVSARLARLSQQNNMPIICVNQVKVLGAPKTYGRYQRRSSRAT